MPQQRQSKREKPRAKDSAVSSLDFNAAPRVAQALRLRRLGYTYAEIATLCGYGNESSARSAVKKANAKIIRDEAQALVGWQLDMIDQALHVVLKRITADDKDSLWAVDRLTPLLKRQSELMGLDAERAAQSAQMAIVAVPASVVEAI